MKKKLYSTNEWKGYGDSYYHNEYYQEGEKVNKYKCGRSKTFDGKENEWGEDKKLVDSWEKEDSTMPSWLKKLIK